MNGPRAAAFATAAALAGFALAGCGAAFAISLVVRHSGGGTGARIAGTLAVACVAAVFLRVAHPVGVRYGASEPGGAGLPCARLVARLPSLGVAAIAATGTVLIWRP